jgi:hypothetical protein
MVAMALWALMVAVAMAAMALWAPVGTVAMAAMALWVLEAQTVEAARADTTMTAEPFARPVVHRSLAVVRLTWGRVRYRY